MARVIAGNKIALHHQVAQLIRQRVRTGMYGPGTPLPSVRSLRDEMAVSINVVYRAVRQLEEEGLVKTHQGKGMTVTEGGTCETAAIFFGVIHPYARHQPFHMSVLNYIDQAFAERSNFCVVRSSDGDAERERQVAEQLVANGVKGLLVWPTAGDPNGRYFGELARRLPVVLVDRLLPEVELPAVVHDYRDGGSQVVRHLFGALGCQRLLAIIDDLRISAYEDTHYGLLEAACDLRRVSNVRVVRWPISEIIYHIRRGDFGLCDEYTEKARRFIRAEGYDAVFCTQGTFVDYGLVQSGLIDAFPQLRLTLMGADGDPGSRKYIASRPIEWVYDSGRMVTTAADLLQRWAITRQRPKGVTRLKLTMRVRGVDQTAPRVAGASER